MYAATVNNAATVRHLLAYGAHVNAVGCFYTRDTRDSEIERQALLIAAFCSDLAVVELLLALHRVHPAVAEAEFQIGRASAANLFPPRLADHLLDGATAVRHAFALWRLTLYHLPAVHL